MKLHLSHKRIIRIGLLAVIVILGLSIKLSQHTGSSFWSDKFGGALYVIFWCLFFEFIFRFTSNVKLVLIVLLATCLLEFTQLYTSPVLNSIRSTFIGRSFIGTTFSWADFPWYGAGAFLAYCALRLTEEKPKGS